MDRLDREQEAFLREARRLANGHTTPPNIAYLTKMGCDGANVWCLSCHRKTKLKWSQMKATPGMEFPDLIVMRRFKCTACGQTKVTMQPDWPPMRPARTSPPE